MEVAIGQDEKSSAWGKKLSMGDIPVEFIHMSFWALDEGEWGKERVSSGSSSFNNEKGALRFYLLHYPTFCFLQREKKDHRWERDHKSPKRSKQGPENPSYLVIRTTSQIRPTIEQSSWTHKKEGERTRYKQM